MKTEAKKKEASPAHAHPAHSTHHAHSAHDHTDAPAYHTRPHDAVVAELAREGHAPAHHAHAASENAKTPHEKPAAATATIETDQQRLDTKTGVSEKQPFWRRLVGSLRKFKKEEDTLIDDVHAEDERLAALADTRAQPSPSDHVAIERLGATVGALIESRKATSERFLHLAEEIGSIRQAVIAQEREFKENVSRAERVIGLVESVQPQALAAEAKRIEAQVGNFSGRFNEQQQRLDAMAEELAAIRSRLNTIRGTEDLIKLHDEVARKLAETQRIAEVAAHHADKIESIFVTVQQKSAAIEQADQLAKRLDQTAKALESRENALAATVADLASRSDLKTVNDQLSEALEFQTASLSKMKEDLGALHRENQSLATRVDQTAQHPALSAAPAQPVVDAERFATLNRRLDVLENRPLPPADLDDRLSVLEDTARDVPELADRIDTLVDMTVRLSESATAPTPAPVTQAPTAAVSKQLDLLANKVAAHDAALTRIADTLDRLERAVHHTNTPVVARASSSYDEDIVAALVPYIDANLTGVFGHDEARAFLLSYGYAEGTIEEALQRSTLVARTMTH